VTQTLINLFKTIFLVDLLKGLWVTLKYTPQPAFTFQYPAERRPTAPRFRGVLRLQTEPGTGAQTCIVCDQCAKACPDDLITAYLLEDALPAERTVECDFLGADPYVPIPAADADDYDSALDALSAVDDEINNASDWWYWDGIEPLTFGCLAGGTIAYQATEVDYEVSLDDCAFSDGLSLTGDGVIHGDGSFTLEVETDGGNALSYARDAEGERSATGTLDP